MQKTVQEQCKDPSKQGISIRVYCDCDLSAMASVTLSLEKSHHLLNVLRLQKGEWVALFSGDGFEYAGVLSAVQGKQVIIEVKSKTQPLRESPLKLHLAQGVCRGEKMDWVIQKAVELGVTEITPLWTAHTNVKLSGDRLAQKSRHWQQVMVAAAEQSGRLCLPRLHEAVHFESWVVSQRGARYILEPMASSTALPDQQSSCTLCVGPEGGFSDSEIQQALNAGFGSLRLGPRILRTETAPLVGLALCQSLWGDLVPSS